MLTKENVAPSAGTTWSARLLILAMWPTAWWLGRSTVEAWVDAVTNPLSVDVAIGLAVATVGSAVAAYLAICSLPLVIARVRVRQPEPPWLARSTPQLWRKVVGVAVGGALGASMATASFAGESIAPIAPAPPDVTVTSAGWVAMPATAWATEAPDAPSLVLPTITAVAPVTTATPPPLQTPSPAPAPAPAPAPHGATPAQAGSGATAQSHGSPQVPDNKTVTVRRGDSLWVICADLLEPAATEREIAQAWPILYRANKQAIGDNPSLIYAGQTLDVPAELRS